MFLHLHSSAFDVFTYLAQIFSKMFYCLSKHFNFFICPLSAMQIMQRKTKYKMKYFQQITNNVYKVIYSSSKIITEKRKWTLNFIASNNKFICTSFLQQKVQKISFIFCFNVSEPGLICENPHFLGTKQICQKHKHFVTHITGNIQEPLATHVIPTANHSKVYLSKL